MLLSSMLDRESLAPETVRPLRRVEYERLVEAGTFADERVELLRGVLVAMSPQGGTHAWTTAVLGRALTLALGERFLVRQHSPFAADDTSMPEPDVAVVEATPRIDHPGAALLVIEVADSSLTKDRQIKAAIYAEAGIPEYWIVDVRREQVEVMTRSDGGAYTSSTRLDRGGVLRPVALSGVEIPVSELFPA